MTLHSFLIIALAETVALSLAMTVAWAIQQRTGNAGWIDATWTFGLGTISAVAALTSLEYEIDLSGRQLLVAALIVGWALRLGFYIVQRSRTRSDDPRYASLVHEWGENARREMFVLLQKQALVSIPLALSVFVAAHNPAPLLRASDALAFAVYIAAIVGEARADRELRTFASVPANRGRVCDVGLWRYSRHPNYFFEWLHWIAYPLLAIDVSHGYGWGWIALIGPLCMYWLLRYISGVPPLEDHMLTRYGPAYATYQDQTSVFFPWPVRTP